MSKKSDKHVCVLCDNILSSKEELKEHFRKHANNEITYKKHKYSINQQKKQNNHKKLIGDRKVEITNTSASLICNKNKDINEIKTLIKCDHCTEQFSNVTSAIQHKYRKHAASSLKFFCSLCGKHFPLKYNLDKHMEQHKQNKDNEKNSNKKIYPCLECGIDFYNEEAQKYHLKSTHQRIITLSIPTPPPSKKIKLTNAGDVQSVYYCHLCGCEYIIKFNLQRHLERQHTNEEREKLPPDLLKCLTCDALFYTKLAYDNHNMYHKPEDLYVSSEEQRLKTITKIDQDFDIRRVQTVAEKYIPLYKGIRRYHKNNHHSRTSSTNNRIHLFSENGLSAISQPKHSNSSDSTDIHLDIRLEKIKNIKKKKMKSRYSYKKNKNDKNIIASDSESDIPLNIRLEKFKKKKKKRKKCH